MFSLQNQALLKEKITKMDIDNVTHRFIEFYEYCIDSKIVRSASQFAKDTGITRGGLAEITKGNNYVGLKTVMKTLHTYEILNRYWLLFGEGEMLKVSTSDQLSIKVDDVLSRIKKIVSLSSPGSDAITKTGKPSPLEIQSIINGQKPFTLNFIFDFLECYPYLNFSWLLGGRGEMIKSHPMKEADKERIQELKYTIEIQKELIEELKAKAERSSGQGIERPHSSEPKGHAVSGMEESD